MLILGILLIIFNFAGLGKTITSFEAEQNPEQILGGFFGSFGLIALGGFLDTTGLFVAAVGGIILLIAHRREITAFTTQQVMPVAKEGIDEIAPTVGKAAEKIAKGVKKGINDADKEDKK